MNGETSNTAPSRMMAKNNTCIYIDISFRISTQQNVAVLTPKNLLNVWSLWIRSICRERSGKICHSGDHLLRSAHASLDVFTFAHRSALLMWLLDSLRSSSAAGRHLRVREAGPHGFPVPTNRCLPCTKTLFFLNSRMIFHFHKWQLCIYYSINTE